MKVIQPSSQSQVPSARGVPCPLQSGSTMSHCRHSCTFETQCRLLAHFTGKSSKAKGFGQGYVVVPPPAAGKVAHSSTWP